MTDNSNPWNPEPAVLLIGILEGLVVARGRLQFLGLNQLAHRLHEVVVHHVVALVADGEHAALRADVAPGVGSRVQDSGFRVQGSGFRIQGSVFRVQDSGFRIQGSGFRIQGSVFRVQKLGFGV